MAEHKDKTKPEAATDPAVGVDALVSGDDGQKVEITFITAKGAAFIWISEHIKPLWLRDIILGMTPHIPVWVFSALGFRGYKPDWSR